MYKTAAQYLGPSPNMTMNPYTNVVNTKENFQPPQRKLLMRESFSVPQVPKPANPKNTLEMKWENKKYESFTDPRVWGPAFWFSLHTSAMNYPINPSPVFRERMKGRILAIPYEIPCPACKPHASAFIEKNKGRLDEIVSSREKLFNFYVDFHNKVNERFNKKVFTYQEAKALYSGKVDVNTLRYMSA